MAVVLNGSSEFFQVDTAAVTAPPFTMACWFMSDVINSIDILMFLGDKDVADNHHRLVARGNFSGDPVAAMSSSVGSSTANSSTGFTADTWFHACGVWAANDDRRAFIDGGSKGTSAISTIPSGLDRTTIGRSGDSTPGFYFPGRIAEAAIWNVALSDAQVASLFYTNPLRVRPKDLVGYWPFHGGSLGIDYSGAKLDLAQTGGSVVDHAPVAPQFGFAGMDLGAVVLGPTGQPFRPRGMMIPGWAGGRFGRVA